MDKDIYVIVAENDDGHDPMGPLVFEQYTNTASKEQVEARVKSLNGRFGECRIARLVFDTSAPAPAELGELENVIDFLRTLPIDCMGTGDREQGGYQIEYPIRDEVIDNLCKIRQALTQQPASKDGVVKEITDCDQLLSGRYYYLCPKDSPMHFAQIGYCRSSNGNLYLENRIWAYEGNNQAMGRWRVYGPIPLLEQALAQETEDEGIVGG